MRFLRLGCSSAPVTRVNAISRSCSFLTAAIKGLRRGPSYKNCHTTKLHREKETLTLVYLLNRCSHVLNTTPKSSVMCTGRAGSQCTAGGASTTQELFSQAGRHGYWAPRLILWQDTNTAERGKFCVNSSVFKSSTLCHHKVTLLITAVRWWHFFAFGTWEKRHK